MRGSQMPFINGRFYMNPVYGQAVENARAAEAASSPHEPQPHDPNAHWVTLDGHHVLIHETQAKQNATPQQQKQKSGPMHRRHPTSRPLPPSGQASIYADSFEGRKTANGETFSQNGYTAALLPRTRWHTVPLGTRVQLTHDGNRVVVEINDRGAGDRDPQSTRALDLSHAAASALTGQDINDDEDAKNAGLIKLDRIEVVPADTPLGPVRH